HGTTLDALKGLKPAFDKNGSVTAGNSSGINDGAAAVVLASPRKAKELGLKPLARIKAFASAGVDPKYMGMGPVPASKRCLSRAGWEPKDLDLMEINEAFAAQAIAVNRQMRWDTSRVNVNGGGIALGHRVGASARRDTRWWLAACPATSARTSGWTGCAATAFACTPPRAMWRSSIPAPRCSIRCARSSAPSTSWSTTPASRATRCSSA